ncbi:histidine--tRNA ligase [Mycoplasmopsis canis UFG4]|uniref:Histidine--tRNA ligase n=1 Tax=Mycoplasmopsis canis UFG4 TaxID=1131455 RepID=I1A4J8_9BACT|nr:histidine--tRNA ligase [Mycoplasmopsis canis]EIE41419.1 histidine--tRNA ligase [Mycoplasmopsis canis UFG4]
MFNKIKGTKDYSSVELSMFNIVSNMFKMVVQNSGFKAIETPIIESLELFKRSSESSDMVKKEMFEFKDKGERNIALRPEGTAPFVRAYIENKWNTLFNQKFYYVGPMFRYEQPQKGRYRQFYQAGIEFVGDKNYLKDAEVIMIAAKILDDFELPYVLKINSIGDKNSRENYQKALKKYLEPFKDQLSVISQERLENGNVLRILDDKVDSKLNFIKKAPKIKDYLSNDSKTYFENLCTFLEENGIEFEVSNDLVRGLDYYDETVFEFVAKTKNAGSQSTVIGGGRYSELVKELGGPEVSSVGFGFGIDRLVDILLEEGIFDKEFFEKETYKVGIYFVASEDQKNVKDLFQNFYLPLTNVDGLDLFFEYDLVKSKKAFERAKKYEAKIIVSDDFKNPDLLVAKNLENNDRVYLTRNNDGLDTLCKFIVESSSFEDVNAEDLFELLEEGYDE